jgi:hypothetical protein
VGFESFRVELSGGTATFAEANSAVRGLPDARPDPVSGIWPDSEFYVIDDGRHVIEVQVAPRPVHISVRFTLCHPPSVDAALVAVVRGLTARLGMRVRIIEDVAPEDARPFAADEMAEFAASVRRAVSGPRAAWVAEFGPDQCAAGSREVYERIILPRCEPVTPA